MQKSKSKASVWATAGCLVAPCRSVFVTYSIVFMYLPYGLSRLPFCFFRVLVFLSLSSPPPLLPPFLRYIHATVERSNILKDSIAPDAKPNPFFFFLFVTAPVKRDNSRPELPSTPDLYTPYSASLFPMQDLPKSRYDLQEIEEIRFV